MVVTPGPVPPPSEYAHQGALAAWPWVLRPGLDRRRPLNSLSLGRGLPWAEAVQNQRRGKPTPLFTVAPRGKPKRD